MKLSLGQMPVEPRRNLMVDNASIITHAGKLQNDDAVVVIQDAHGEQDGDNVAWQKWRLNNPDGLEGFAKINSGSKRIEQS